MARRKLTLVLSTVALIVVAGAGVGGYQYTQTPAFTLTRLVKAVRNHDTTTVHQYLDVQATATQVVNAVVESATAKVMMDASNESGFAAMGAALGAAMIEKMKPALVLTLRSTIDSAIATPDTRYL